jgi:soluble lytic murein transglycosylase-like protein
MLKSRLLQAVMALAVTVLAAQTALAGEAMPDGDDAANQVAAINGGAGKLGRQAAVPAVLSESDVQLYRSAFDGQERGQWAAADRDIQRLKDPLLVGHLLAQRYLSAAYRTQPEDLADWMARFSDLPEATAIYDMARQRMGARIAAVKLPAQGSARPASASTSSYDDPVWEEFSVESNRDLGTADRRHQQDLKDRFRTLARQGKFDAALALFDSAEAHRLFDEVDVDELRTDLAIAYFGQGHDEEALQLASQAADRSGDVIPEAHWVAGLALWRSGDHGMAAARHFEAVGNASDVSSWLISAGAYWAARANLSARRPELVNHWLQRAAAYPRTFYGLLARRALGEDVQYSWDARPFTDLDGEALLRVPAARRALALLQVGDRGRAEDELRHVGETAGPALSQSLLALSHSSGMPALALAVSGRVESRDGRHHDSADYPLPDWHPVGGWNIDRALLLAIARQESSFNPKAKSPCGAIGLMQLMPRTARSMGAGKLTDPQVNLELGQRYVRHLLDDDTVKGNLLFLAASYNSGPGNVARWLQNVRHNGDALLFLESIPVQETRAFVEQVMTNFWAYRNRLGQSSPSLDAVAAGDWPLYDGAGSIIQAVKHVQD